MKKHYHVISGMGGGYMPNENTYVATKKEAIAVLKSERDQIDDALPERRKRYGCADRGVYTWSDPENPDYLGYYVEIVSCDDESCVDDGAW